jgi:hypothetical protein
MKCCCMMLPARTVTVVQHALSGNYKGAIEQWVKNEQVLGNEKRAEELRLVFEKTGYRGYLRKDAKDKEVEGEYYDAACDYAMLGDETRILLSSPSQERPPLASKSISSNLIQT